MTDDLQTARDLLTFIDASPTPYHCVAEVARRLEAGGFSALDEAAAWHLEPGGAHHVIRDGALVAFRVGSQALVEAGFRVLGAHTDSPNLRVKPQPNVDRHGYRQLGVEIYGGSLTYTWLDRDLGLAGAVMTRGEEGPSVVRHLLRIDEPLLRVPSLAVHLNRDIRSEGLKLNDQDHLAPVLAVGAPSSDKKETGDSEHLQALLARRLKIAPETILAWDLSLMDLTPATLGGEEDAFIFAPRLDNQAMCHAATLALLRAAPAAATQVICLYDHEEVGSGSAAGAGGVFASNVLRRLAELEGPGAHPGGLMRAAARSLQISADMAHAVHPNYADRHEPQHLPKINRGPVIKLNAQQRYATDATGAALFAALCRDQEVPFQKFVNRTDLPCGSTIGPISAARLGIRTLDVGNPMLSMHSIREQAGSRDPEAMTRVMTAFLAVAQGV